jgi:hypothetical protein
MPSISEIQEQYEIVSDRHKSPHAPAHAEDLRQSSGHFKWNWESVSKK